MQKFLWHWFYEKTGGLDETEYCLETTSDKFPTVKCTIPNRFFTDPVDRYLNEQLLWRHAGTQSICIETYTEYSGFQFQDDDVSHCSSSSNLKAEDLLLIEKNHLEAKAEKARLTSMQNSRTTLTQK